MFFKKKNQTDLNSFLSAMEGGNNDILELLKLEQSSFQKVSHSEILENPGDIGSGVINVETKFDTTFFGIFDKMLIKDYDNGDRTYILYCTSNNFNKMKTIISTVVDRLGIGITDTDRHVPIRNEETLKRYTEGSFEAKDMVSTWLLENLSILLQYRVHPENEFSMFLTSRKEKQKDSSTKSNGTILDLLKANITDLLLSEEDSLVSEPSSDGFSTINKYTYTLKEKELDIFDQVTIQQIGTHKDYSCEKNTNITFHCSKEPDYLDKIQAIEKLISLYGWDNLSSEELELHEIDIIQNLDYWTGRNWTLNEKHQLWDSENESNKIIYNIDISYDSFDMGFNLSIISYSGLIDYFKAD